MTLSELKRLAVNTPVFVNMSSSHEAQRWVPAIYQGMRDYTPFNEDRSYEMGICTHRACTHRSASQNSPYDGVFHPYEIRLEDEHACILLSV